MRTSSILRIQNSKLQKLTGLLLDWFSQNARDLPWRRTRDPYAIWVSEIMLQQTQVKTVMPYWKRWMRKLPTIRAAANASPDKIHKLWEGLGYYTRARNLQKAAQQVVAKHDGRFPQNFDDVLALPGVGRYTAGAICSIAFNQPTPILDGNVIRVLTRIFGIGENPREKKTNARLWQLAEKLVVHASRITHHASVANSRTRTRTKDEDETSCACSHLNQSLMELGALVCTPRNPQCKICPVKIFCIAFRENRVKELPNLGRSATATARHFVAFVVKRNGRLLVQQRRAGVVNAHLWEFPNIEIGARPSEPQHAQWQNTAGKIPSTDGTRTCCVSGDLRSKAVTNAAIQALGFTPQQLTPFCTVKHSITRFRITLEAFAVSSGNISQKIDGVWKTLAQMERLAFTSAHRKVLCVLITTAGRCGHFAFPRFALA